MCPHDHILYVGEVNTGIHDRRFYYWCKDCGSIQPAVKINADVHHEPWVAPKHPQEQPPQPKSDHTYNIGDLVNIDPYGLGVISDIYISPTTLERTYRVTIDAGHPSAYPLIVTSAKFLQ